MPEQIAPFRSDQGQAEYLTAYDAALARWPIP